jgi:hypothetical protein
MNGGCLRRLRSGGQSKRCGFALGDRGQGCSITLELTTAGRRTVKAVVQRIGTIQERLFKGYDRHQRHAFFAMLRTIESRLRDMQEVPARQRSAWLSGERQPAVRA